MGHRGRVADEGFDAAETLGRHEFELVQHLTRATSSDATSNDSMARHWACASWRAHAGCEESRVDDLGHLRMLLEKLRERDAVGRVLLHAQRQRLGAAQYQPCIKGAEDGAGGVL
jgi:hypothetical protein